MGRKDIKPQTLSISKSGYFFLQTEATSEILPAVKSHKFIAPWWLKETHCFSACIVQISVMLCYIFVCFFLLSYTIAQTRNLLFSSFHFPFKKKERKKEKTIGVCLWSHWHKLEHQHWKKCQLEQHEFEKKKKKKLLVGKSWKALPSVFNKSCRKKTKLSNTKQ